MKKILLVICVIEILMASCILNASPLNKVNINEKDKYISMFIDERQFDSCFDSNIADFGIVGSINRENSFGNAIVSKKSTVEANWVKENPAQDYVNGQLKMTAGNFIINQPGETLDNIRISTYKIIVHNGSSTTDPILFSGQKEFIENEHDVIQEINYPFILDLKKDKTTYEFAVERIVETELISNIFHTPMSGKYSEASETSLFRLLVDGPTTKENDLESIPSKQQYSTSSEIEVSLGTIEIYSKIGESNIPIIHTDKIHTDPIHIPVIHDDDVTIKATITLEIDLPSPPKPHKFLGLGCKAHLTLEGGYYFNGETRSASCDDMKPIPLTEKNLHNTSSLSCYIDVNTKETKEVLYVVACDFSYYPINVWDFSPPWESFKSEYVEIIFDYV